MTFMLLPNPSWPATVLKRVSVVFNLWNCCLVGLTLALKSIWMPWSLMTQYWNFADCSLLFWEPLVSLSVVVCKPAKQSNEKIKRPVRLAPYVKWYHLKIAENLWTPMLRLSSLTFFAKLLVDWNSNEEHSCNPSGRQYRRLMASLDVDS
jgi:hypothetical protein